MTTTVSELLALKIENVTLKIQALVAQQAALVEEARVEVQAPPEALYNVQTRAFQPAEASSSVQ